MYNAFYRLKQADKKMHSLSVKVKDKHCRIFPVDIFALL